MSVVPLEALNDETLFITQVVYDYDRTDSFYLTEGCWKVVVGTRESPGEGAIRYTTTATAIRVPCDEVKHDL